jgi:DeoR family transcriptional regulator, copper-sensing transcriptional repressor
MLSIRRSETSGRGVLLHTGHPAPSRAQWGGEKMAKRWRTWGPVVAAALLWLSTGAALAAEGCPVCGAPPKGARFVVTTESGETVEYGCPRCALTDADLRKAKDARVADFHSRRLVDARKAFYVRATSSGECCQPYWLGFAKRKHADKFAKGFGGTVLTYEEALEELGN